MIEQEQHLGMKSVHLADELTSYRSPSARYEHPFAANHLPGLVPVCDDGLAVQQLGRIETETPRPEALLVARSGDFLLFPERG
jgi:hypothetical protein